MSWSQTASTSSLLSLPTGVLIALGAVVIVSIGLDVFALVDLVRRPTSQVALGNKWAWVAIIILVNPLGAILYLAVGRRPAQQTEQTERTVTNAADRTNIADALYGEHGDSETR